MAASAAPAGRGCVDARGEPARDRVLAAPALARAAPVRLGVAPPRDAGDRDWPATAVAAAWMRESKHAPGGSDEDQSGSPRGALERRALENRHFRVARSRRRRGRA